MRTKNIFFILTLLFFGASCRSVVDWDLEPAEEKLTIESYISDLNEPWKVHLSRSRNYFDNEDPGAITDADALVTISDDQGNVDTLVFDSDGIFMSDGVRACVRGRTYTLEVQFEGETYSASELCRDQLEIDTVFYFFQPTRNGFIEPGYYVFELAQEIPTPGDHYQWQIFRNDTLLDDFGYIIDTDELADFSYFNSNIDLENVSLDFLPRPFPFEFQAGDEVVLEQRSISRNFYDYLIDFSTQYNQAGSPFDAPPANPIGNVIGALGYFAVFSVERRELKIPEQ